MYNLQRAEHAHRIVNANVKFKKTYDDDDITQIHHCLSVCLARFRWSACLNILIMRKRGRVHLWAKPNNNNEIKLDIYSILNAVFLGQHHHHHHHYYYLRV